MWIAILDLLHCARRATRNHNNVGIQKSLIHCSFLIFSDDWVWLYANLSRAELFHLRWWSGCNSSLHALKVSWWISISHSRLTSLWLQQWKHSWFPKLAWRQFLVGCLLSTLCDFQFFAHWHDHLFKCSLSDILQISLAVLAEPLVATFELGQWVLVELIFCCAIAVPGWSWLC